MKTKLTIILAVSAAFFAGYLLGCDRTKNSMSTRWKRDYLHWNRAFHAQELNRIILILTEFREGNPTNGIAMLEKSLDSSLITTAACDADLNDRTNLVPTFFQEAYEYRKKYPWTNSVPDLAAKVQKILSLAK